MIKLFKNRSHQKQQERQAELYRNLIRHEAKVGGKLFGPVPEGTRREFFCLDKRTWVWHEEWEDKDGELHTRTTRYDVRPQGIMKAQESQPYQMVSLEEAHNLLQAIKLYKDRVVKEVYSFM
jgi:hypothetical protein